MSGMNYGRAHIIASLAAVLGWGELAIGVFVFLAGLLDRAGLIPVISGLALAGAGLLHILLATIARAVLVTAESSERIARNTER